MLPMSTHKKLKNDASDSTMGTVHQFYVALNYCFELVEGEKLFIETFGDISISNSVQIEVKEYKDSLTDLHENLWKTLSNWLDDGFHHEYYKTLILLTTQDFGTGSQLKEWNNKSSGSKFDTLKSIQKKYQSRSKKDPNTEKLVNDVMSEKNSNKLKNILGKFIILTSALKGSDLLNNIKSRHARNIDPIHQDDYVNSLFGFILSPAVTNNCWSISCYDFDARARTLSQQYFSKTRIFPEIKHSTTNEDILNISGHLFVKKIEDIEYHEVKSGAISDYIKTRYTIHNELKSYSLPESYYNSYKRELVDHYDPKFRTAKRGINNINEINHKSQTFYDEITGAVVQPFFNFSNPPTSFRNGFLHIMANEENQNIKWKLKEEDEND
jgi:hypothetical protein